MNDVINFKSVQSVRFFSSVLFNNWHWDELEHAAQMEKLHFSDTVHALFSDTDQVYSSEASAAAKVSLAFFSVNIRDE